MKIFAQHGHNPDDKITEGLKNQVIDGVIFGAKDISCERLQDDLSHIAKTYTKSQCFFDPHYYATFIAKEPGARLGKLGKLENKNYSYFRAHMRRELEQVENIKNDIRSCLEFQASLPFAAFISPNIVIKRSFDSIEGVISKNFIRNTAKLAENVKAGLPVYATLAVSENVLKDKRELTEFLQEITEMENPPDGFYLLLEKQETTPPPCLVERDVLARWMFLNYVLKINGFNVINGYTDLLAPYIAATGADAVGTGWYGTLKNFSLQKFLPSDSKARQPLPRYTSVRLLKSIRQTELETFYEVHPGIVNNLPGDAFYNFQDDHPTPTEEALQNWEALRAMIIHCTRNRDRVEDALHGCRLALNEATELYAEISDSPFTLRDRSNNEHIAAIREELDEFAKLAELQTGRDDF